MFVGRIKNNANDVIMKKAIMDSVTHYLGVYENETYPTDEHCDTLINQAYKTILDVVDGNLQPRDVINLLGLYTAELTRIRDKYFDRTNLYFCMFDEYIKSLDK